MTQKVKGIAVPFVFNIKGYPASSEDSRTLHDSIYTILSTTPGERVMRPTFGSWLRRLVYDNVDIVTAVQAEVEVRRALREWEPRIAVSNVQLDISPEEGTVVLSIDWVANGEDGTTRFRVNP